MTQAGAHAAAFYAEVARSGAVWSIRDAQGYPAPINADGHRAQPFWSTRRRAEAVVVKSAAYASFEVTEIPWPTFRDRWVPGLTRDHVLVGLNWSGKTAHGFDVDAVDVKRNVEAQMESRCRTTTR